MKVFISWSGKRGEHAAKKLEEWLEDVLQFVKPFCSSGGIHAGAEWFSEIRDQLDSTSFGVMCLTPESRESTWIHFEAGALAKTFAKEEKSRVCPVLFDLKKEDVSPPFSQFQMVSSDKDGFRELVESINAAAGEESLSKEKLDAAFKKWWPDIENLPEEIGSRPDGIDPKRLPEEMTSEILEIVRSNQRRLNRLLVERGSEGIGLGLPDSDRSAFLAAALQSFHATDVSGRSVKPADADSEQDDSETAKE